MHDEKSFAGVAFIALLAACGAGGSGGEVAPNVLLIVADDLGYADVGMHGSPDAQTPAIDSIAANGVRFTNAYVSAPYCSPSRAGLMTGRYQERFGHVVFTTAIRAAGGSVPTDRVIDGVDLLPYLRGIDRRPPHDELFWRFGEPESAIRAGNWKLKLSADTPAQLYDLASDVGETTDLAPANPPLVAALQADLDAWKSQLIPPLWERRF